MSAYLQYMLKFCKMLSPKPDNSKVRLVTVGFSHFCEKARWALDISGMDYYEEVHAPAMHLTSTLDLANAPRITTWETDSFFQRNLDMQNQKLARRKEVTAIPKLVLPEAILRDEKFLKVNVLKNKNVPQVLDANTQSVLVVASGSSGILRFLHDSYPEKLGQLYPSIHTCSSHADIEEKVIALEGYLDTEFAFAATNWAFGNMVLSGSKEQFILNDETGIEMDNDGTATGDRRGGGGIDSRKGIVDDNRGAVDLFVENATSEKLAVPAVERWILRLGKSFLVPLMIKANRVDATVCRAAVTKIHEVFSRMDALLEANNPTCSVDAGGFLFGTPQPTAADIAFAALSIPIVLPPQTDSLFPSLESLDQQGDSLPIGCLQMRSFAHNIRNTYKSAQFVLDLYARHRFPSRSGDPTGSDASSGRTVTLRTEKK